MRPNLNQVLNHILHSLYLHLLHIVGQLDAVDNYIKHLPRKSNGLCESAKKISMGLSELHTVSAMDLPGVLLQVSLALGAHNSPKMPVKLTSKIQRVIGYFFVLHRSRKLEKHAESDVKVRVFASQQVLYCIFRVFSTEIRNEH